MYRWQLSSGQLHSHHVCNGKPTNKAVTFLMAKKTTHTNQKNIVLLSFNVLHLKHKILRSWFLSHHSYSDLIYHTIEIPTTYLNFRNTKAVENHLGVRKSFDGNHVRSAFSMWKLKMAHGKKILSNPLYGRITSHSPDPWNFTSRRKSK